MLAELDCIDSKCKYRPYEMAPKSVISSGSILLAYVNIFGMFSIKWFNLFILMDYPIHIETISMELSILYFI